VTTRRCRRTEVYRGPHPLRTLTGPQVATLLRWADEQGCPDAVARRFLACTGTPRRDPGAALGDLDMETGRVSIRRSVGLIRTKGEGSEIKEGPTKTGSARVVALGTSRSLRSWRVSRAGLDLRLARDDALIFGTLDGGYQHPERFSRRFTEQLVKCRCQLGDDAPPKIRAALIFATLTPRSFWPTGGQ
jgi:hypothetical protein